MRIKEFYDYLKERETVRLRKAAGLPFPWTADPILQEYKFTNVFRKHDRTTQKLNELYYSKIGQVSSKKLVLFNCALFRYFGTWEFAEALGWQETFDPHKIISLAATRLKNKQRVFTGAYIITNQGIKAPKEEVVVNIFLHELWQHADEICEIAEQSNSWHETHEALQIVQGFGGSGFMAKETLLDTMHCNFWRDGLPDDYWDWTPIGPGARRGINRVLGNDVDKRLPETEMLTTIKALAGAQDEYWPREWERIAPTDVQFQLCEFDKIERVRHGEGRPRSRYREPK